MPDKQWMIKYCKCCENENIERIPGFPGYCYTNSEEINPICSRHNVPMEVIDFPADDFTYIRESGGGNDFLRAMIELRKSDIIEYQIKLSTFKKMYDDRTNREYDEYLAEKRAADLPKCPRCGSTSIGVTTKGFGLFRGFIGSGTPMNVCQKCGLKWNPKIW